MLICRNLVPKLIILGASIAVAACSTNEAKKDGDAKPAVTIAPEPTPPKPPESRAAQITNEVDPTDTNLTSVERRFADGLAKYNDGNFAEAIKVFKEPSFDRAWPELRYRSMKYLAFSYCVSGNGVQCKKTFVDLLKLEPSFDLSSAERGHPLWGPVFQEAKAEASKSAK